MERTSLRNSSLGRFGEDRAAEWLADNGFRIVERNWRCPRGEIDIVAWQDTTLVFVEVKTRSGVTAGHPFDAVTESKVTRLRRLVPAWFVGHPDVSARQIRIDAVAVHVDVDTDRVVVEHVAGVL
jgi:putative endonuclease